MLYILWSYVIRLYLPVNWTTLLLLWSDSIFQVYFLSSLLEYQHSSQISFWFMDCMHFFFNPFTFIFSHPCVLVKTLVIMLRARMACLWGMNIVKPFCFLYLFSGLSFLRIPKSSFFFLCCSNCVVWFDCCSPWNFCYFSSFFPSLWCFCFREENWQL